jgi:hypothetical protein
MINKHRTLLAVAVLSLATGSLVGPRLLARLAPPIEYSAQGNLVEKAVTVAEQTRRADLIVRARIVSLDNRIVTEVLPVYAEDAVTVLEERESSTAFTDVTLEVLETFKGDADSFITALQTGGTMKKGRFGRAQKFEIAADPLFEEGSEHILFLVDITGDGVHSTGRQLYRVVNPMGRYEIKPGGLLRAPVKDKHLDRASLSQQLPQSEKDLRRQIAVALTKMDNGDSQNR